MDPTTDPARPEAAPSAEPTESSAPPRAAPTGFGDLWTEEPTTASAVDTQPSTEQGADGDGAHDGAAGEFVYGSRVERFAKKPWYLRPWVMLLIVAALAGGLRFWHLSDPKGYIFDEVYYAKDGCYDAGYPYKQCKLDAPGEQTVTVHPPIGRELIALSIRLWGNNEFGWRFGSAVAGTLSVVLLALLAWKLFDSVAWGYAGGILLATESLNLVQSRVSMLDIYIALFVVAGFLFVVLDRYWIERRTPALPQTNVELLLYQPPDSVPSPIFRPWRIAAGVAFGLATATKWSGGTALIGGIILVFAWECTRRRRAGVENPVWKALKWEGFGIFVFMVLIPAVVYFFSYTRWFLDHHWDLKAWASLQHEMATFSLGLRSPHPYASPAWKWILMWRPVAYYFQCPQKVGGNCITTQAIVGMGNPFVFWGTVITFPYAVWAWMKKRDWRAGLVVVAFAVQYLPWFFAKRTSFLFYMTPVTPFMVLIIVYALRDLSKVRVSVGLQERSLAPVSAGLVVVSVAMFAFFFPVLVGMTTSWGAWHLRMWFPSWV
jgi:dolichyl-phosphate-mannose--protein O-mannosyl transferase